MLKYLVILFFICFNLNAKEDWVTSQERNTSNMQHEETSQTLTLSIGQYTFKVLLYENETTRAFRHKLPLTLDMNELNGNEKYFHFPINLPTHPFNPKMIHSGDLMLWGSNSLVLFYQTFSTSYAYTKIGYVEDTTHLEGALGKGNVLVKFTLE